MLTCSEPSVDSAGLLTGGEPEEGWLFFAATVGFWPPLKNSYRQCLVLDHETVILNW